MKLCFVYCLFVYTREYVIYIMHVLLEIYCCFKLLYSGGFGDLVGFRDAPGSVLDLDYRQNGVWGGFRF